MVTQKIDKIEGFISIYKILHSLFDRRHECEGGRDVHFVQIFEQGRFGV